MAVGANLFARCATGALISLVHSTISSLLNTATNRLGDAQIDSPRLTAELLLGFLLQLRRVDLSLRAQQELDAATVAAFDALLVRRLRHEPVQYILGETEWYGLRVKCDRRALIPRPETELIVERALELIKDIPSPRVTDIGTGTGCIAIAIATHRPDASVRGTDSSYEALTLARENAALHSLSGRVEFAHGSLFEPYPEEQSDLVISNPPYVRSIEYPILMPEVRLYEPESALVAGDDGLETIRQLLFQSPSHLKAGGLLVIEFGLNHAQPIRRLVDEIGQFTVVEIIVDYNQHERGIVLQKL